jgi:hypothetical protein
MKARQATVLVAIASVLLLALAAPVLADGIPMFVDRIWLIRTGRSTNSPDKVAVMVRIRDENDEPVAGATVTTSWTLPGGGATEASGETCSRGVAAIFIEMGALGEYKACVTGVAKDGYSYDAGQNLETCSTIEVW